MKHHLHRCGGRQRVRWIQTDRAAARILHTSLANAGSGHGFTISAQIISVSLSCRSVVEAKLNDLMCCYRIFPLMPY